MSARRWPFMPDCYEVEDGPWRSALVVRDPARGWSWGEDLGPFDPLRTDGVYYATAWGAGAAFLASVCR